MSTVTWITDLFKCIDSKASQGFTQYLSEDGVFCLGNSSEVHGRKPVMQTVEAFFKSIRGLHHTLEQIWNQRDTVISHGMVTYTRHDGSSLTVPFANIFTLSSDRVSCYLIFVDVSALYTKGDK
jgi:ketosteroid isomerase-like protein